MIFQTQHQFNCLIIFLFAGLIFGVIFTIFFCLINLKNQKKLTKIIFDSVFYLIFGVFFIFFINFFNFGKFSLTLLFAYIIGFKWIKILIQKSVVIFFDKCYTKIKSRKHLKETIKQNEYSKKS